MYASPADVRRYLPDLDGRTCAQLIEKAQEWVELRTGGIFGYTPQPVREATALLAAVFHDDPHAVAEERRVPNMVRLMLVPFC